LIKSNLTLVESLLAERANYLKPQRVINSRRVRLKTFHPIGVGDSSPAALADASRKTGRPKQDFELRRISRDEYEALKRFFD
jgi:hypothetical protein